MSRLTSCCLERRLCWSHQVLEFDKLKITFHLVMKFKDLFAVYVFKTFYGYFVVSQIHFEQSLGQLSEIYRRARVCTQLSVGDVIISRPIKTSLKDKRFTNLKSSMNKISFGEQIDFVLFCIEPRRTRTNCTQAEH